jgi:hypothetical protein
MTAGTPPRVAAGADRRPGGRAPLTDRQVVLARLRLRTALRRARADAGFTQKQVAHHLDWSASKVIRIEGSQVGVSKTDLMAMLRLYGIDDQQQVAQLLDVAYAARRRGMPWALRLPAEASCREYVEAATGVCQFASLLVPPLLRTEAYARAVRAVEGWDSGDERPQQDTAWTFDDEQRRPSVLDAADPPRLRIVVDEAVLHRPIPAGDVASWRAQLQHLGALAGRDRVDLRVLPFTAGWHAALVMIDGDTLLEFEADLDPLLVRQDTAGSRLVDDPDSIRAYRTIFGDLWDFSQPAGGFLDRMLGGVGAGSQHAAHSADPPPDVGGRRTDVSADANQPDRTAVSRDRLPADRPAHTARSSS